MKRLLIPLLVVTLAAGRALAAEGETPWWKQEKIRFMWGKWIYHRLAENVVSHACNLPLEVFQDIAEAGATLFAELEGHRPGNARFAHEAGLKYFVTTFLDVPLMPGGRGWVMENGEVHSSRYSYKCPLDEASYEKWLVTPYLKGIREGLIDGIHVDWEGYGGRGEGGVCYCDFCFSTFPGFKASGAQLPAKPERCQWITDRNLMPAYEEDRRQRRVAMFRRIREKLHAANPQLLFSSYNMVFSEFSEAMHTPETPFIVVDARHYYNHHRQPWWESYGAWLREQGYLYLPGGWTNALFGAQASEVSAARWIYEASINEDGVWLWFERELDDEILRAYATADREIQAVLGKVGTYLFDGERDGDFVTAVEWTGRPEVARALIHQTYHLDEDHLVHVNNVDIDWPLRVRLRFPRLPAGERWTVRDALADLYYSRHGKTADWTRDELLAGVVLTLEPRSDLFLLVSPSGNERVAVEPSRLMHSREFDCLPGHAAAAAEAFIAFGGSSTEAESSSAASRHLVYTATEPMGFQGPEGPLTIGNALRTVDAKWQIGPKLRQLRGHLWSPRYSPDGERIAFVHDAGGRGQVYVMTQNGTDATNVSDNAFCDRSPVWSPDGRTIAFMSDRTGDWDIYAMDADGGNQRRLAGNTGLDRAPAWSPDGERLAWESHVSVMPDIWVCRADGSDAHPVIQPDKPITLRATSRRDVVDVQPFVRGNEFHLTNPVWSPDGTRIAGAGLSGSQMVYVLAADGSSLLQVIPWVPYAADVCWSPDGKYLAGAWSCVPQESEHSGVFVVDAATGEKKSLVDVTPSGPRLGGARRHGMMSWYSHGSAQPRRVVKTFASVAWSPDGETLAFSSDMDPSGAFYVYTIPAAGGEPSRLDLTKSAWPQQIMWRPR